MCCCFQWNSEISDVLCMGNKISQVHKMCQEWPPFGFVLQLEHDMLDEVSSEKLDCYSCSQHRECRSMRIEQIKALRKEILGRYVIIFLFGFTVAWVKLSLITQGDIEFFICMLCWRQSLTGTILIWQKQTWNSTKHTAWDCHTILKFYINCFQALTSMT